MKNSPGYYLLLCGSAFWCLLILLPPLCIAAGQPLTSMAGLLYSCFSHVCHQYDVRSLHIAGNKLAVCSRCTSVYFGFFVGVLLCSRLSRQYTGRYGLWVLAALPMVIDVMLDTLGVSSSTLATRVSTGAWFGILAAIVLTRLFIEGCHQIFQRNSQGAVHEFKT